MYIFDINNFVNELIAFEFMEIFACIASITTAYYLCRVYKNKLYMVIGIYVFKMLIMNIVNEYLAYKVWPDDKGKFYVNLINLFCGLLMIAVVKIASPAKVSEIILMTLLHDAVAIVFFLCPYYIVKRLICNNEVYFYDSPKAWKTYLMIFILIIVYLICLWIIRKIVLKLSKYYRLKRKISIVLTYVVFGVMLFSSFTNYHDPSIYKNGNMILLFILIVAIGVTLPYLASIHTRKRDAKEELERNEKLVEERNHITELADDKNDLSEEDRKFRHDIDKHMNVIKEMVDEGANEEEVKEYAESIKETYK